MKVTNSREKHTEEWSAGGKRGKGADEVIAGTWNTESDDIGVLCAEENLIILTLKIINRLLLLLSQKMYTRCLNFTLQYWTIKSMTHAHDPTRKINFSPQIPYILRRENPPHPIHANREKLSNFPHICYKKLSILQTRSIFEKKKETKLKQKLIILTPIREIIEKN